MNVSVLIVRGSAHRCRGLVAVYRRDTVLDGRKAWQEIPTDVSNLYTPEIQAVWSEILCRCGSALHRICQEAGGLDGDSPLEADAAHFHSGQSLRTLRTV